MEHRYTPQPQLLTRLHEICRLRHLSPRTEKAYAGWIRRFAPDHNLRPPAVPYHPVARPSEPTRHLLKPYPRLTRTPPFVVTARIRLPPSPRSTDTRRSILPWSITGKSNRMPPLVVAVSRRAE